MILSGRTDGGDLILDIAAKHDPQEIQASSSDGQRWRRRESSQA